LCLSFSNGKNDQVSSPSLPFGREERAGKRRAVFISFPRFQILPMNRLTPPSQEGNKKRFAETKLPSWEGQGWVHRAREDI
jgi:hypothetical protein